MKKISLTVVLCVALFASYCSRQERGGATLPDIDISASPNGVVTLPGDVSPVFTDVFSKYTKIIAPNGKPIHLLAQSGWSDIQIVKARNVLQHILTDVPGSEYGDSKAAVANAMADRKAAMVLFNTPDDLRKAFDGPLRNADLSMQDLRANECPAEGTEDYMNHVTRDASYEEILHLVHDYGIKPALPGYQKEITAASNAAAERGWRGWPDEEPENHPNEYIGVVYDSYLDLWAVQPKKYEGRVISPGEIPEGTSHFGRYFANSRAKLAEKDPAGYAVIEKFFPPYLTYTPELPASFSGTFSLTFDETKAYTCKSQHLRNVTLTGGNSANLTGNAYDNVLTGNDGDNVLTGGPGDDRLDGGAGTDTAVYEGSSAEYTVTRSGGSVTVHDKKEGRDGTDTIMNVEILRFRDGERTL